MATYQHFIMYGDSSYLHVQYQQFVEEMFIYFIIFFIFCILSQGGFFVCLFSFPSWNQVTVL